MGNKDEIDRFEYRHKKPYTAPKLTEITFNEPIGKNIMETVPVNEAETASLEVDITAAIIRHRADDKISLVEMGGTLINILFAIATSQRDPKEAVDQMKIALDDVCKVWYEAKKPDVMGGLLKRCLDAKGKAVSE